MCGAYFFETKSRLSEAFPVSPRHTCFLEVSEHMGVIWGWLENIISEFYHSCLSCNPPVETMMLISSELIQDRTQVVTESRAKQINKQNKFHFS